MRYLIFTALLFLPTACSLAPVFERPKVALPQSYSELAMQGDSFANLAWWDLFKDPVLANLVRVALAENRDLKIAAARIEEVRGILGFTEADQFPRIEVEGLGTRFNPSNQKFADNNGSQNDFGIFSGLSFELDFWGRLRSATEAARADLLSTEESYRFITISLISEVANTYFRILDLDSRLRIAERTIRNRTDATKVINDRLNHGIVSEIDLNQSQIELSDAQITAVATERELRITENAMRILLGSATYSIARGKDLNALDFSVTPPVLFPAELLNRRPDLLASEQLAKAEVARIGVARAEQLPTFNLLGTFGLASNQASEVFTRPALTWSIGSQFVGPLIDFGKSKSQVDSAEARAKQALLNYEQAVLRAVQEVEDSLIQLRTYKVENGLRLAQVKAAQNAARLSRARYDDGFTSYLEVLDIERSLFTAELNASRTKQFYLNSMVRLYKALGGGWTNTADTAGPLFVAVK